MYYTRFTIKYHSEMSDILSGAWEF